MSGKRANGKPTFRGPIGAGARTEAPGRRAPLIAATVLVALAGIGTISWVGASRARLSSTASSLAPRPEPTPAPALETLPAGVDSARTIEQVASRVLGCENVREGSCAGIVYLWSPRMPLSRSGIGEIAAAAEALGVSLDVVMSTELNDRARLAAGDGAELGAELVAAGASLHEPALVVHSGGRLIGSAILGYKSAEAYQALLAERLSTSLASTTPREPASAAETPAVRFDANPPGTSGASFTDLQARGQPGAYFRWVPGRNAVAYESGGVIYLLDLERGESRAGPGFVDFVPTPDGKYFVTPGRNRALEFYDAAQVFQEAAAGRGRQVRPFFVDQQMQDQYPSVGIISTASDAQGTLTVYRVLTSWYDRVAFRDYEVRAPASGNGPASVRALGPPVEACAGYRFSIPIMSQTGLQVAGRDEATATTKVLRIAASGSCTEEADLGLATGKVAWSADGRRLAFAIPAGAVSDGSGVLWRGEDDPARAGMFTYDRQTRAVARVEASLEARRLTFPEFVGNDRLIFLLPGERPGMPNRFRLVCCFPSGR